MTYKCESIFYHAETMHFDPVKLDILTGVYDYWLND